MPARVEAMGCAAGLSRGAVHSQLAATGVLVVHLVRDQGGRRLSEIRVLRQGSSGLVRAEPAVAFTPDGHRHEHPGAEEVAARLGRGWRR